MSDRQTSLDEVGEVNDNSEDDFRSIRIGPRKLRIPTDWEIRPLDPEEGATSRVTDGAHHSPNQSEDGEYYYATVSDMSSDRIDYDGCGLIDSEQYNNLVEGDCKPRRGEVLFSKDGTVGLTTVFNDDVDVVLLSSIAMIDPVDDILNPHYLSQYLSSDFTEFQIQSLKSGTAIRRVVLMDIEKIEVPIPSLEEQRKIATVLHTVDQAIQKTEEIVEQVKRIEQGLLQDLFSGEYLDCEYQTESTLGRIPEHWDALPMSEVCNITMGSSPKSEYYNESGDGLPFFQANNEFGLRNPTNDRWCSNPVKTAKKGDSLMTIRGTYVGQMNIADKECCIGRGLAGISAGDKLDSEYLYHHLRRRERYVKSIAIGSTFDSVSSGDLENLLIAVPPEDEQKQIADILQRVQQRIIFSEKYLDRLSSLKKGLMQDLLSGEIRTADRDINIHPEVKKHG